MVSILKHLATSPEERVRARRVHFHWVVREQSAPRWVEVALQTAQDAAGDSGQLDVTIHYTGGGRGARPSDAQKLLLVLAQEVHAAGGRDLIANVASPHGVVRSEYGRPDWGAVFRRVQREDPRAQEIGVVREEGGRAGVAAQGPGSCSVGGCVQGRAALARAWPALTCRRCLPIPGAARSSTAVPRRWRRGCGVPANASPPPASTLYSTPSTSERCVRAAGLALVLGARGLRGHDRCGAHWLRTNHHPALRQPYH